MNPLRNSVICLLIFTLPLCAEPAPKRPATVAEGARDVVAAIVRAAQVNARLPARREAGDEGRVRLGGDELTIFYVREAARAARRLPDEIAASSLLVALGVALDDSQIVRSNPLTARLCKQVETDAERDMRLRVVGQPTMLTRRDWTQHFVVSCFLVETVGEQLAETAGILKEQLDARPGGSGFSFGDLSADLAGVTFAVRLKKGDIKLAALQDGFVVEDYVPKAGDLVEGLSEEKFAKDYGSVADKRFLAEVAKIRKRIDALPGYKESGKK
jgi:hypothetical protein